jgi:hypothetical protein
VQTEDRGGQPLRGGLGAGPIEPPAQVGIDIEKVDS